jgi:hypothetical protein
MSTITKTYGYVNSYILLFVLILRIEYTPIYIFTSLPTSTASHP